VDAMAILKVLYGSALVNRTALVNSAAIRTYTRIGFDEMTTLLEQMVALGWVGRVRTEAPRRVQWGKRVREDSDNWVLLINPSTLKVADVYRLFVFGGKKVDAGAGSDLDPNSPMALDTTILARQVETAVENGLDQTLAEHFARGVVPGVTAAPMQS
jgi:membrane protein